MTHKLFYVDFFFAILSFLIVLNFSYRFLNVRIIFIMSSLKLLSVGSTVSIILKSASVGCFCFHYGPSILLICISDHFLLEVKYCVFCAEDCWVLLWFLKIYSDCVQMFSSVQFSRSVVSNSLRPHELQHARPPCPSPTPRDVHHVYATGSLLLRCLLAGQ